MKFGAITLQGSLGLKSFIYSANTPANKTLDLATCWGYSLYCYKGTCPAANGGSAQWRLPPASQCKNQVVLFKNLTDNENSGADFSYSVKIVPYEDAWPPTSYDAINGHMNDGARTANYVKLHSGDCALLFCDGAYWYVLLRYMVGNEGGT